MPDMHFVTGRMIFAIISSSSLSFFRRVIAERGF